MMSSIMAIPVFDLGQLSAAEGEREKLVAACQHIGCFRVVNHGVSEELQARMKATLRSLFELPDHVKRRSSDAIVASGYTAPSPKNPLYESFGLYNVASPAAVDAFCSELLDDDPQGQNYVRPDRLRETMMEYAARLQELAMDVSSKLAESLGVQQEGRSFREWPCELRMNRYSFTAETVGTSGVQIHTDSGFLTVLQEDDCVGGLEVMDPATGWFFPVDPVPGSFLVNVGDVAKAWSNGRLHNVKHRVECKEPKERISVALFLLAPKDDMVEPPAAFVDADHPRLYQTFSYEDYRKLRLSTGLRAGEALSFLPA